VRRTRNIFAALFFAFLIVSGVRLFLASRSCQFTPDGDARRERQQVKTGKDPCLIDQSASKTDVLIDIALIVSASGAIGMAIGAALTKYRDPSLRSG
jgi:uncharacterized membrane protein YfcA